MKETWKPVIGYSSYLANSRGDVISLRQSGTPRSLKGDTVNCSYNIVNDKGQRRIISKRRLAYAFRHDINPDSIDGYVIGTPGKPQLVSREEFYAYTYQKMAKSKALNREKLRRFYNDSLRDIRILQQFYETGDIIPVSEAVHQKKEVIVDYVIRVRRCNRVFAEDVWSSVQAKFLLGLYRTNLAVLNIHAYLLRMVRNDINRRKKENYRTMHYEDFSKGELPHFVCEIPNE